MFFIQFTRFETSRLILRRFALADLDAFMAYRNDPEVARYQSWDSIDEADARAFIAEQGQRHPELPGSGFQFAMELKETGALIGDVYMEIKRHDHEQAEIGFTLATAHQRRGYATEAVSRVLNYAFRTLELHRVVAVADCRNERSLALMERLGMRREAHFIQNVWFKGAWGDEYLYAILQDEWLCRQNIM